MSERNDERQLRYGAAPRCEQCGRTIPANVPPAWDVLSSTMFCSVRCRLDRAAGKTARGAPAMPAS